MREESRGEEDKSWGRVLTVFCRATGTFFPLNMILLTTYVGVMGGEEGRGEEADMNGLVVLV